MLNFAGWNFFGNATSVLNTQGINLLINVFFGVIANSARGIASQVEAAVNQLIVTFTTAVNPQITKSYAQGDTQRMNYLVCKGAKFSFFMLMVFVTPLIFETDIIIKLWLKNVPEGAALFTRLALIGAMVNILGNSGYTACIATGNIKKYSIIVTLIGSLNFVITWIAYKLGASVEITYYIYIIVYSIVLITRLKLMKEMLQFPIVMYVKEVLAKIMIPLLASLIIPYILQQLFIPSIGRMIFVVSTSVIWTILCITVFGLTKGERVIIFSKVRSIVLKLINK